VTLAVVNENSIDENDPYFELKVIDFLIYSHVLNLTVPHPIPKALENDPGKIAGYSFSMFGNRGHFATYE
jgi:hypothetical protein